MANVLGALFSDIAKAIREKTGESETMKPNEFPSKISGITVSNASFTCNSGAFFSGEGGISTIAHGMGCVPDMIVVYVNQVPQRLGLVISVGYSQAMLRALGEGGYAPSSFVADDANVEIHIFHGMESTSDQAVRYSAVREVNEDTFVVGGGEFGLMPEGGRYNFFAISGMV